jgi:hypothetical protein
VPESLPEYDVRDVSPRETPSPALPSEGGSQEDTGDVAKVVVARELLGGAAVKRLAFHAAGRPMTVESLPSPSLSLFTP